MEKKEKDALKSALKRKEFINHGFALFVRKSIDAVTLQEVADSAGYGIVTLYRYFGTKQDFVIAVSASKWEQVFESYRRPCQDMASEGERAVDIFSHYLTSFIEIYKNHKDLLYFNQMFNIYIKAENVEYNVIQPYQEVIQILEDRFHRMYLRAQDDHSLRTDIPEKEMFSATLHLMLAAVTRYAVGLVYDAGIDPEKELRLLKDMLMKEYTLPQD